MTSIATEQSTAQEKQFAVKKTLNPHALGSDDFQSSDNLVIGVSAIVRHLVSREISVSNFAFLALPQ